MPLWCLERNCDTSGEVYNELYRFGQVHLYVEHESRLTALCLYIGGSCVSRRTPMWRGCLSASFNPLMVFWRAVYYTDYKKPLWTSWVEKYLYEPMNRCRKSLVLITRLNRKITKLCKRCVHRKSFVSAMMDIEYSNFEAIFSYR